MMHCKAAFSNVEGSRTTFHYAKITVHVILSYLPDAEKLAANYCKLKSVDQHCCQHYCHSNHTHYSAYSFCCILTTVTTHTQCTPRLQYSDRKHWQVSSVSTTLSQYMISKLEKNGTQFAQLRQQNTINFLFESCKLPSSVPHSETISFSHRCIKLPVTCFNFHSY